MNRIQIGPLATIIEPEGRVRGESPSVQTAEQLKAERRSGAALFAPLHYEPGYAYPLIVWLHSNGDDQSQVQRVLPTISLRNYVAVAPQSSTGNTATGYFWEQTASGIEQAQTAVLEAIDFAQLKMNISSQRIFLAGYGSGGTMAYRLGLQLADLLAGIVSINGPLPSGLTPLRDWMSSRQVPIYWAHCRRSREFDEEQLCDQLRLLHVAGFNVTLRQYPCGDELPAQSLTDLNRWIMESIGTRVL